MEQQKKPIYKKWWFWVIIVFVFVAMLNGNKTKTTEVVTSDISPEASTLEVVEKESASVADLFTQATGIKDAEIEENDVYTFITYDLDGLPYDYTAYVNTALTDFVKTGKLIFSQTEANAFRMDMKADGDIVTSLIMDKESFESVPWSDIAYLEGTYDEYADKFQKFYVESVLMKDVDTNKIMYKGK